MTLRTREIGIHMALGAQVRAIVALMLADTLRLAAIGVALGLALALALTRFVSSMLFQVNPIDPATLMGTIVLLMTGAGLACLVPARRAAKVDPMIALRAE